MKIEILFPEYGNLFGDLGNMMYLKACLPNEEFIETSIDSEPAFVTEDVNLIYMGPMTGKNQEAVIQKLLPYKDRIEEFIRKEMLSFYRQCNGGVFPGDH